MNNLFVLSLLVLITIQMGTCFPQFQGSTPRIDLDSSKSGRNQLKTTISPEIEKGIKEIKRPVRSPQFDVFVDGINKAKDQISKGTKNYNPIGTEEDLVQQTSTMATSTPSTSK